MEKLCCIVFVKRIGGTCYGILEGPEKKKKKNKLSWHFSAWTQPMSKCLDLLGLFGHHGMNSRHFRAESNPRQKQVKEKVTWKGHERRNNLSKNNCCPTDLLKKVPFGALRWWNHCLNPLQDTILRPFSSDVPGALATDWASRVATRGTSNCTDSSKIWLNATWTPLGAPQQWHQRIKDGELPGYHEL